jgi:hypothetical protein
MSEAKRGRPRSQSVIEVATFEPWENEVYTSKPTAETIKEVIKDFDYFKNIVKSKDYHEDNDGL